MSKTNKPKKPLIIALVVVLLLALGGAAAWWFLGREDSDSPFISNSPSTEPIYSNLTGLEIANAAENTTPTYCVQIPNGSTDGARPQVGLDSAAVVFEAIAETGITRFAAVYQNPPAALGPIRSLRPYYLEWDTPFDCTVVHDGGSDEALAKVGNGTYRNLDEDFNYMWNTDYISGQYRYWNNVFTSGDLLAQFNSSKGYNTSSAQAFPRLKPAEVSELLASQAPCIADPDDPAYDETCIAPELVTHIRTVFTNVSDYIVNYAYDADTNTYPRTYETDEAHLTYSCTSSDLSACDLVPVAPSAVAVIRVQETTMSDNYHEDIKTTGEGKAYIFQNGTVTEGTWQKSSVDSQIIFRDLEGSEISFTPGQLWISAVPQFGSVTWD